MYCVNNACPSLGLVAYSLGALIACLVLVPRDQNSSRHLTTEGHDTVNCEEVMPSGLEESLFCGTRF